jgi:hypothetical protein
MTLRAPAELVLVEFPGNRFEGAILGALADLVEAGTITVLDMLLVSKDAEGVVSWAEIDALDDERFLAVAGESSGHLGEDDVLAVADELEPESSVGMLIFEHRWARDLTKAIQDADGRVLDMVRIPATTMAIMSEIIEGGQ